MLHDRLQWRTLPDMFHRFLRELAKARAEFLPEAANYSELLGFLRYFGPLIFILLNLFMVFLLFLILVLPQGQTHFATQ